mmetsp:Transcript_26067/g.104310  ORF Transcript_26067/g.104310 Transcript_26067/m.104310 type:complete len:210 (+) Transcript_26067:83-712(+)
MNDVQKRQTHSEERGALFVQAFISNTWSRSASVWRVAGLSAPRTRVSAARTRCSSVRASCTCPTSANNAACSLAASSAIADSGPAYDVASSTLSTAYRRASRERPRRRRAISVAPACADRLAAFPTGRILAPRPPVRISRAAAGFRTRSSPARASSVKVVTGIPGRSRCVASSASRFAASTSSSLLNMQATTARNSSLSEAGPSRVCRQ